MHASLDPQTPRLIADYCCDTGENPLWNSVDKRLYWCDIQRGRVFAYDPAAGSHRQCFEGEAVGGFTVEEDGALLLFMARGAIKRWKNGEFTTIIEEIPEERDNRFNDVIADPTGRVYCGVMSTPKRAGRLYRLDRDRSLTVLLEGIGCSNGMGFTLDHKRMYYTDSDAREIYLFDYDQASGAITNQRVVIKLNEADGLPDGLTIDAEGCVWSACWNGGLVIRYTADGRELSRVPIPAKKVTSLTFGGPNYTDLFITSAAGESRPADDPLAGALFHMNTGFRGLPEFFSRITK